MNYFRCLLAVDESLGNILSVLEEAGVLDDTFVVFTSDNGFSLGAHRLRSEKFSMYEESIRIPLLIRYPRLISQAKTIPQMVSSVDIAPTLLEVAGAQIPATMQGRSILPLFQQSGTVDWDKYLFYQYFHDKKTVPCYPTILGVRTEQWKYISYPELRDDIDKELYDLNEDPHEIVNLATNQEYSGKLNELKAELNRLIRETRYTEPEATPIEDFFWNLKLIVEETNFLPRTIQSLYKRLRRHI